MKEAVVLGLGPAGLFLSRQLNKAGYIVYGIGKSDDIGRYSNTLTRSLIADTAEELVNDIKDIVALSSEKPQAWICSDGYLTEIIKEKPKIFSLLNFSEPSEPILRLMADKDALIIKGIECGIPFPSTFTLQNIEFPVVLKPNIKEKKSPLPKIMFANSAGELDYYINLAESKGIRVDDLIIQQAIRGNNSTEYGYGGYFRKGIPICDVAFIQARQYPQGVSCYAVEITDTSLINNIKNSVSTFLTKIEYTGFVQFDLKQDEISGKLFVLDINPRPWGSVSLLQSRTKDSHTVFNPSQMQGKTVWRFPMKELMSIRNKKNLSYSECRKLAKAKNQTIIDLWSAKDPLPFLMQPIIIARKFLHT